MHTIVLGAGVTGVTAAWYLARAGADVTVVDAADAVAAGTSYANAAQLSYSFVDALATPDFLPTIPGILAGRELGAEIGLDRDTIAWGLKFLAQCRSSTARATTIRMLELANESARLFEDILNAVSFDFDFRRAGKCALLADEKAVRLARREVELKRRCGSGVALLTPDEALGVEPTLEYMHEPVAGVVYSAADTVGDARAFSRGLAGHLERQGVAFRLGVEVGGLDVSGGRVTGVVTADGDRIAADAVVVALGTGSRALLARVGLHLPIIPVRGYSVTLPIGARAPQTSITSRRNHFVFTRLGQSMRVAGFTDFRGFETGHDERRVRQLVETARKSAPLAADYEAAEAHAWGGFRPMTPDTLPRWGGTKIAGLYLNTGHGMLGWTLAPATAAAVAQELLASLQSLPSLSARPAAAGSRA